MEAERAKGSTTLTRPASAYNRADRSARFQPDSCGRQAVHPRRKQFTYERPLQFASSAFLRSGRLIAKGETWRQRNGVQKAVNSGALQAIALTEDRLDLRRDERAQSGVAAMMSGCGHGARERWSRRSCTALTERIRCEACRTCKQGAHGNNYFPKRDCRWPARIQRRRRSSDPLFKKACFTMRVVAASHNAVTCISLRSGSRLHPHGLAGTFRG